jgi:hypothetical protein
MTGAMVVCVSSLWYHLLDIFGCVIDCKFPTYVRRHLVTAHFSQLTNMVLTLLALIIACSGVHSGLNFHHWPMKRKLFLDQKGCQ